MMILGWLFSLLGGYLHSWWQSRKKPAEQAIQDHADAAVLKRDNAALVATNQQLTQIVEKAHEEPAPKSYDGDVDALFQRLRRHDAD